MSDTVTITKEQLRRAVVAGWSDCIPAAHMSLDDTWAALVSDEPVPDDVEAGGLYGLDSWECWGDDV